MGEHATEQPQSAGTDLAASAGSLSKLVIPSLSPVPARNGAQKKSGWPRRILASIGVMVIVAVVATGAYTLGIWGESASAGVAPASLRIESLEMEAPIEEQEIIDGEMQDPSEAFVVAWYFELGHLGVASNVVLAGHLDYWEVGKAVFFDLAKVKVGEVIQVVGENGKVFEFEVVWVENYVVEDLTPRSIYEIVGPTGGESITLMTCGGPFNEELGDYEERTVVRGTRIEDSSGT